MRSKSRIASFVFAAMAVALSMGVSCGAAEVLRVLPVGVVKAEEGADLTLDVLKKILKSAAEQAGFEVEDVKPGGDGRDLKSVGELVSGGGLDVVIADVEVTRSLRGGGIPMVPFITFTAGEATSYKDCFFVRKADKDKPLGDFRGAVVSGWGFNVMRKLLYDAGIDEPVDSFLGEVRWIEGMHPKWIIALDKGEIDGFMAGILGMGLAIATNPVMAKKVTSLACAEGLKPFPAILVREDLPEETRRKLLDAFTSKGGRKNLDKKYAFFTKNLRWEFVPAGKNWDAAFESYKKFIEFAVEKGWDKEPYWGK